jgi:hypothetical protein
MKTIVKTKFPKPENKALSEKLFQLVSELPIAYIFYHAVNSTESAHVIIITTKLKDVEIVESRKWIRNEIEINNILFHIIYQGKMFFNYKIGNPFIACYCQKSAIFYKNPQAKECFNTDWHSFKKIFKRYSEQFFHDRDVLLTQANRFHRYDSFTNVFLTYRSIYEYNINYLETLYIGRNFDSDNLHQRLKHLASFIPRIGELFVKKNGNEYYLISQLERVLNAAKQADEIFINEEQYENIKDVEKKLYEMVSCRFSELKKLIKSGIPEQTDIIATKTSTKETELSHIITQVIKIQPVEEIYLFHKIQNYRATFYYLLLIGEGLGTKIMNRMQQSVMAKFNEKCVVVLTGHSRLWIQKYLFIHQLFFQKIMRPENIIFQSHSSHFPVIHWEKPYTPSYPDLDHYYKSANKLVANYFILRNNSEKENVEGLNDLFSKSLLRIFRTFVFSKLSYLPHYLSAFNLWKLCVHAEPKLQNIEFLFEKLNRENFFKKIGHYTRFHHDISCLHEEELLIMDEILNLLLQELDAAVISKQNFTKTAPYLGGTLQVPDRYLVRQITL